MSVFLRDDFTSAGAMDGTLWVTAPGAFGGTLAHLTKAGGYCTVTAGDGAAQGIAAPPNTDYYVKAQCLFPANINAIVRVGLRWIDNTPPAYATGYYVEAIWSSTTVLKCQVITLPSAAQLDGGIPVSYTVASAASVLIELRAVGTAISLYFDGVLAWSGINAAVSGAGRPFFNMPFSGVNSASIDWIEAGSLVSTFWTDFIDTFET